MKHFISSIFIVILFSVFSPIIAYSINENQLVTELKVFDNDSTFRYVYLYNDGKKALETKSYKQDNVWISLSQTEWIFNLENCTNQIERIWKDNEWQNTFEISYIYINGVLDSEIHSNYVDKIAKPFRKITYQHSASILTSKQEYSYKSDVWLLMSQTDFKYSENNKTDSTIITVFQSLSVIKQYLMKNFYNSDGSLSSQLQQEKEMSGNWVNTQLINWHYKDNNSSLILFQRTRKWISEISAWENYQRTDYEYDDFNHLTSETYQYWKTMFWESDLQYEYIYDANERLIKKILSKPIYHEWRGLISINYSDFKGTRANLMESKYEFWGGNTGELVTSFIPFSFNNESTILKGKSLQIIYQDTTMAVPVIQNDLHSIPVYPNPSDGIYYVDNQKYIVQSWIITDLSGHTLKNHVQFINSGVIDITDLPKGIYVLKVKTRNAQLVQKLIKQ